MLTHGKRKRSGGRDMKFRTRITLGYAALALAISLGLGMFYNMYIIQKYETAAFNQFGILSEQMLNNLDENIQKMTQVTLSLLSDQDAVQTIRELSVDNGGSGGPCGGYRQREGKGKERPVYSV